MSKEMIPKTDTALNPEKAELDKRMRRAGMVANSVIYLGIGGFYFLEAQPFYHYNVPVEVVVLTVTLFAVMVAAANLAIYRHYKQNAYWRM